MARWRRTSSPNASAERVAQNVRNSSPSETAAELTDTLAGDWIFSVIIKRYAHRSLSRQLYFVCQRPRPQDAKKNGIFFKGGEVPETERRRVTPARAGC